MTFGFLFKENKEIFTVATKNFVSVLEHLLVKTKLSNFFIDQK